MYLKTDEDQYNYSKKKEIELQERWNEMQKRHIEEEQDLKAKIDRHHKIIDNYEMNGEI